MAACTSLRGRARLSCGAWWLRQAGGGARHEGGSRVGRTCKQLPHTRQLLGCADACVAAAAAASLAPQCRRTPHLHMLPAAAASRVVLVRERPPDERAEAHLRVPAGRPWPSGPAGSLQSNHLLAHACNHGSGDAGGSKQGPWASDREVARPNLTAGLAAGFQRWVRPGPPMPRPSRARTAPAALWPPHRGQQSAVGGLAGRGGARGVRPPSP